MKILPTGNLPLFEPNFTPGKLLAFNPVWYRRCRSHLVCGTISAGKTTLLYHGIRELAAVGVYREKDLKLLKKPSKTGRITRFSLERIAWVNGVDSWIDMDGEGFDRAFQVDGKKTSNEKLEKILRKVNAIITLITAQQAIDLMRLDDGPGKDAKRAAGIFEGYQERLNSLDPHLFRRLYRLGFRLHLVVSQCGDVLGAGTKRRQRRVELAEAVKRFAARTGFDKVSRHAILCDSVTEAAEGLRLKVARVETDERNRLSVANWEGTDVCSAGVTMAMILKRLKTDASYPFLIRFDE